MATEALIDAVLRAGRHVWTAEERDASRRPPYPLPTEVEDARRCFLGELDERLPQVPELTWVVMRRLATRQPFRSAVEGVRRRGDFSVADAVCVLLAGGLLSLADVDRFAQAVGVPSWSGLPRQVVHVHLAAGRVADAEAAAETMGEEAWLGHRDIALVLAELGDVPGVLVRWRDIRPGTQRREADAIRGALVKAVARRDGWRAALELSADARIGKRFAFTAFSPLMNDGKVDALLDLFVGEAEGVLDEQSQLSALVRAIRADSPRSPDADHPALADVLDRILAIDPTVDKATMRVRDSLLFECWFGTGDEHTLRRVRSAVRTPMLRRELMKLPREVWAAIPTPLGDEPRHA